MPAIRPFMSRERRNDMIPMPQRSTPQICQTSTFCAEDSLVRHFQSLAEEGALTIPAALSSLKLPDWLNPSDLRIFCSKTFRDCCRMTKAGRFLSSSPRLMTWGTAWNGWCLTANILESRNPEGRCSLSAILIPDAPEKYFLSSAQVEKLLYKSSEAHKAPVSTTQTE